MKNVVKLNNYYCPEELEDAIAEFVDYYNNNVITNRLITLRLLTFI